MAYDATPITAWTTSVEPISIEDYRVHHRKSCESAALSQKLPDDSEGPSDEKKTRKSMTMDEMEEQMVLVEEDGFHAPHAGTPLEDQDPFTGMLQHAKSFLTPLKLGTSVVLMILVILGVVLVDATEFNFKVTVPNVRDFAGCLAICEQTKTDTDFARTLGGEWVCTTVKFEHCSTEASYPKLKIKNCVSMAANEPGKDIAKCKFFVSPETWKPYATLVIFVLAAQGCFEGGPPDILLLGAGCIMTIMGIITRKDLFAGMTNSGVLGLAVLSPISKAIGDSGIM